MAHILVVYATRNLHTAVLAFRMGERLRDAGHEVALHRVGRDALPDVSSFDAVVLGGPLYRGGLDGGLLRYARAQSSGLSSRPVAVFTVGLPEPGGGVPEAARDLQERAGFTAAPIGTFGGVLAYTRYGFWSRLAARRAAAAAGAPTDTSRDHVLTRWEDVARFADEVSLRAGGPVTRREATAAS